jgi:hypothetical protein
LVAARNSLIDPSTRPSTPDADARPDTGAFRTDRLRNAGSRITIVISE